MSTISFILFGCMLIVCALWLIAETKNWNVGVRVFLGVGAIIFVAAIAVAFSQVRSATREHYYRSVLVKLSREAVEGNRDFVCNSLERYSRDIDSQDDMKAIIDLYRSLQTWPQTLGARPKITN